MGDRLKRADRAAELGADLGVVDGHLQAAACASGLLGGERDLRPMDDGGHRDGRRHRQPGVCGHDETAELKPREWAGHIEARRARPDEPFGRAQDRGVQDEESVAGPDHDEVRSVSIEDEA